MKNSLNRNNSYLEQKQQVVNCSEEVALYCVIALSVFITGICFVKFILFYSALLQAAEVKSVIRA